jgi:hypothetical protein
MPNRLKPLNLTDFTGGVNLRPESYQLQENELPELLNLEVDPRGGLNTRNNWKAQAANPVIPAGEPYLAPVYGTVSTPDPGPLPDDCTFIMRVSHQTGNGQAVFGQWGDPQSSFILYRGINGGHQLQFSNTGTAGPTLTLFLPVVDQNVPDVVAVTVHASVTPTVVTALRRTGSTWTEIAQSNSPDIDRAFDSNRTLDIGGWFDGRIYSVELRTGLDPTAGTVVWRFDAADYRGLSPYIDPRGRTWTVNWTGATPPISGWNPRNAYLHSRSDGINAMLVVNGATLYTRTDPSPAWITYGLTDCTAVPHGADFASWNNDAWIVRGGANTIRFDGSVAAIMSPSGAANWQNDYTGPSSLDAAPIANLIAQHQGYMFVAGTTEDGVKFPNRVRWSHPNKPTSWAKDDYIDLSEGGQRITAIISFSDRLVIFKPDAVWALFGYDADTWTLNNISRTVGCLNQQLVCRNEAAVFFLSWPQGVFAYSENGTVNEISTQIRRVFEDKQINPIAMNNAWMGWVGRRLWVSMPYTMKYHLGTAPPADALTAFVFDPVTNSWTTFEGVGDNIPGPYIERVEIDDLENQVSFVRKTTYLVRLDSRSDEAVDEYVPGVKQPFNTLMRTKWMDAGAPTWKKSWRRPDFLLRALVISAAVNVQVFQNFDSSNAARSFLVDYTPDDPPAFYSGFTWGDGTVYGGATQTSSVERGGTMGRAGAVQLLLSGVPGVVWGLNGIIFKFIPRRFR